MLGYHAGRPLRHEQMRYLVDPPTMDEILAVIRHAARNGHGLGCVRLSSSFGASRCASRSRRHSPSTTSITGADRARLLPPEIIAIVRMRGAPVMSASAGLRL